MVYCSSLCPDVPCPYSCIKYNILYTVVHTECKNECEKKDTNIKCNNNNLNHNQLDRVEQKTEWRRDECNPRCATLSLSLLILIGTAFFMHLDDADDRRWRRCNKNIWRMKSKRRKRAARARTCTLHVTIAHIIMHIGFNNNNKLDSFAGGRPMHDARGTHSVSRHYCYLFTPDTETISHCSRFGSDQSASPCPHVLSTRTSYYC